MKHLLNGVAIAAVLAIAAPGLAQAGSLNGQPEQVAAAMKSSAKMMPKHRRMMHHRAMKGDMANDLNRQELSRIVRENAARPPMPMNKYHAHKPKGG